MSSEQDGLPFWRELLSRWVLLALVLAPFAIYAPRVLFGSNARGPAGPLGRSAPAAPQAAWLHLVVVTTSTAPAGEGERAPHLREWRERSSHARSVLPATDSSAGNAASLWTGRFAAHHGVLDNEHALAPGAWTLAEAARRSGAATAAYLEAPFVRATRIGGFEVVVESPELAPDTLLRELQALHAAASGRRTLVWIHVDAAASELDGILGDVSALYRDLDLWPDTATLIVPLLGRPVAGSGVPKMPAWIGLPARGWGGRRSDALIALSDLTALLRHLLRVPPPDPLRRESPLQGRTQEAVSIARGWDPGLDALVHTTERTWWVRPGEVFIAPGGWPCDPDELRLWAGGEMSAPDNEEEARKWHAGFEERERTARHNAVPAPDAELPRAWRDAGNW